MDRLPGEAELMPGPSRGTIAYFTVPKIGGTYNFYLLLRRSLEPLGWRVLAPVVGKRVNSLWDDRFADDGCRRIAADELDMKRSAQQLVDWCVQERVDVFVPMSVQAAVSAIPHLPENIHVVMRCSNITRHAYDIVVEHPKFVDRIVATSKRQYDDLHGWRRVPTDKLVLIPHAIDIEKFEQANEQRSASTGPLRIGFVGRLANPAKGIFLIPKILDRLRGMGTDFDITIVGDGPDRGRLEKELQPYISEGNARLVGGRPPDEIPHYFAQMDVMLMPSHFEGFGFSLIEAMAAGVVPLVARIQGVTDWIVENERTGYVFSRRRPEAYAECLARLARDRALLERTSQAAVIAARDRFSLPRLGTEYDQVFAEAMSRPKRIPPADWSTFVASQSFEPRLRQLVPGFVYPLAKSVIDFWRNRA